MKIKLTNNLRVLMKSRKIDTWNELVDRLAKNQGYDINRTSLARHGNKDNPAYTLELMEALCNELQCLPDALFHIDIEDADEAFLDNARARLMPFEFGQVRLRKSAPAASASDPSVQDASTAATPDDPALDELLGPKVTHMSKAKLIKK